jgi:predicted nucleotidyltransferase
MFSATERDQLKRQLVERARADPRIGAAALLGSSAAGTEDAWSDIDLGLELAPTVSRDAVIADWSRAMYDEHRAAHHVDVLSGQAVYRVFLLGTALQVDVSFWPSGELVATSPRYRQLFGAAPRAAQPRPPDSEHLIGMAWLYALHARSSIQRGRPWQAEYMLSAARDQVLGLACARAGVPASDGRGFDSLPPEVLSGMSAAMPSALNAPSLTRALNAVLAGLASEAEAVDLGLAKRLKAPLDELGVPI